MGKLVIDPSSYRVSRAGKPLTLSTLEFRLFYYLAARPNRVFTRDQLLDAVWGTERFVTPRSVDVYIRRLREKVEVDPENPGASENRARRRLPVRIRRTSPGYRLGARQLPIGTSKLLN